MTAQADILKAALWLEQEAHDLKLSHTVRGRWAANLDALDRSAKQNYDEWRALAKRLRAHVRGMR